MPKATENRSYLTATERAAISGAASPSGTNVFATMNDIPAVPPAELTADELAAIQAANAPTALNPMATMADVGAAGAAVQFFSLGTPAFLSYDGVHAAVVASDPNAFPGPIGAIDVPRVLQVQISDATTWDGGTITVDGTDWQNLVIQEVFTSTGIGAPENIVGTKAFKTVTAITKGAVGVSAATASVGYENVLAIQTTGTPATVGFSWKSMGGFPSGQASTIDVANKTVAISLDGVSPYYLMISVTP